MSEPAPSADLLTQMMLQNAPKTATTKPSTKPTLVP